MHTYAESLWAIRPEALSVLARLLTGPAPAQPSAPANTLPASRGRTTVIPIRGVLTNDGPDYFGSNYQAISSAVEKAAADPDVKHIILSIDSPGGNITGLPEAAAVIASAAKVKPVTAIVDGTAASAAYWLASQASSITLTPSGEVGSVGVRMMHVDMSKALDDAGLKVTELHSGEFKTEWSPYKPLSEDAQADMQTRLDANYKDFIGAVASGRGQRTSAAVRKSNFGNGRMFSGKEALSHGLVDKLMSSRDAYRAAAPVPSSVGASPRRARLELERARVR